MDGWALPSTAFMEQEAQKCGPQHAGLLPLSFYCLNARLCLKKAAFAKKCCLVEDELESLKTFEELVSESIPAHPLFPQFKADNQLIHLQSLLHPARKRLSELQANPSKAAAPPDSSPLKSPKIPQVLKPQALKPPDHHKERNISSSKTHCTRRSRPPEDDQKIMSPSKYQSSEIDINGSSKPAKIRVNDSEKVLLPGHSEIDLHRQNTDEGPVGAEESSAGSPLKASRVSWKTNISEEANQISDEWSSCIVSNSCKPRGILKHRNRTSVSDGLKELQSILEDGLGLWENETTKSEYGNQPRDPLPHPSDAACHKSNPQSVRVDAATEREQCYAVAPNATSNTGDQTVRGDAGLLELPPQPGKDASDNMGELTQDVICEPTVWPAGEEGGSSCGDQQITNSSVIARDRTNLENPDSVQFVRLDQNEESYLPEIAEKEYGNLSNAAADFVEADDENPSPSYRQGGPCLGSNETEFVEAFRMAYPSCAPQTLALQAANPSTISSLSHDFEGPKCLGPQGKGSIIGLQGVSTKILASGSSTPDISEQFCVETDELQGYAQSAADSDSKTFSNPVFDFEPTCLNEIFPENDSRPSFAVMLQDEFSEDKTCGPCEIGHLQTINGQNFQMSQVLLDADEKNLPSEPLHFEKLEFPANRQHLFHLTMSRGQINPLDPEEEGNGSCVVAPKDVSDREIEEKFSFDQNLTSDGEDKLKKLKTKSDEIYPMQQEEFLRHVDTIDLNRKKKVANLQTRMCSLQSMVEDLKDLVGNFSVNNKQEDDDGWYRMQCLEKEIKDFKEETACELFEMKKIIKDEIKLKLDQIKSDTKISREELELNLSEYDAKLEMCQTRIDSLLSDAKTEWIKSVKGKLGRSAKALKCGLKKDVEQIEQKLFKDLQEFKELLDTKLEGLKGDRTMSVMNINETETFLEEKLETLLSTKFRTLLSTQIDALAEMKFEEWLLKKFGNSPARESDILTEEKLEIWFSNKIEALLADKMMAKMKSEFCLLKAKVEDVLYIKEKMQGQVELVGKVVQMTLEDVQRERIFFKSDSDVLKNMVETVRNEGMLLKLISEGLKKGFTEEMEELRRVVGGISSDRIHSQAEMQQLRESEESQVQMVNLRKAFKKVEVQVMEQRSDIEAFKQVLEHLESSRLDTTQKLEESLPVQVANLSKGFEEVEEVTELRSELDSTKQPMERPDTSKPASALVLEELLPVQMANLSGVFETKKEDVTKQRSELDAFAQAQQPAETSLHESAQKQEKVLQLQNPNLSTACEKVEVQVTEHKSGLKPFQQAQEQNETSRLISTQALEKVLQLQMSRLGKAIQKVELEVAEQRSKLEAFKQVQERTETCDNAHERTLNLKATCNDSFEILYDKGEDLQKKQENACPTGDPLSERLLDAKVEEITAVIRKDKNPAETPAVDAATLSHTAEEFLKGLLASPSATFLKEIASARWNDTKLEEMLVIERNSVEATALGAQRSSEDLKEGRETGILALFEAQKSCLESWDKVEQESQNLKHILALVDRQRLATDLAASKTIAVEAKGQTMLSDITNLRSKTNQFASQLSKTVVKAISCTQQEYFQEIEKAVAALRTTMHVEISKAKSVSEELNEVKRKASTISSVNVESSEDRLVVYAEVKYFIQKSETAVSDLATIAKDATDARDTSMSSTGCLSRKGCLATKEEVDHLAEKIKAVISRIEGMTQIDTISKKETEDTETVAIKSGIRRLEKQLEQVSDEQCILREKVMATERMVWEIGNWQIVLSKLLKQFKEGIGDLGEVCHNMAAQA